MINAVNQFMAAPPCSAVPCSAVLCPRVLPGRLLVGTHAPACGRFLELGDLFNALQKDTTGSLLWYRR
jgi:hypothetical protein